MERPMGSIPEDINEDEMRIKDLRNAKIKLEESLAIIEKFKKNYGENSDDSDIAETLEKIAETLEKA